MSKHTPAPWVIIVDELSDSVLITTEKRIKDSMVEICEVPVAFWSEKFQTEQRANARLIASAPELLEALKLALDALGGNDPQDLGFEDSICGKIRQAIAKAEGTL